MLKRFSPFFTAAILSIILQTPAFTNAQISQDAQHAVKIKANIAAIGAGARVSVKLRDGKKLTGRIESVGEDTFVITDAKSNVNRTLAYSDILKAERMKGLSTTAKVLIGVGATMWLMGMIFNGVD
jgi:hypothetical protein